MDKDKKTLLTRYIVCICVAAAMIFAVFTLKGFFTSNVKDNMQILTDAFFATGALFVLFYGLLFVSGEGIFLGVGFVFSRALRAFIPGGRLKNETYAQYRERKSEKLNKSHDKCILFTGLFLIFVSVIFLIIFYQL